MRSLGTRRPIELSLFGAVWVMRSVRTMTDLSNVTNVPSIDDISPRFPAAFRDIPKSPTGSA